MPSNSGELWNLFEEQLSEDFPHQDRRRTNNQNANYSNEIYNQICSIILVPTDTQLPLQFRRLQFPRKTYFATTLNKSQGHPLYAYRMGCPSISARKCNKAYTLTPNKRTRNVVHPEARHWVSCDYSTPRHPITSNPAKRQINKQEGQL